MDDLVASVSSAPITGATLIAWGYHPGPDFPALLERARALQAQNASLEITHAALLAESPRPVPVTKLPLRPVDELGFSEAIEASDPDEVDNLLRVRETMRALMRTPTVEAGAVMPDACPAGPVGTIPVGGVVAARNAIHPGMHSADICCSVMLTDLGSADPKAVLDAAAAVTHFGNGSRPQGRRFTVSLDLLDAFRANPFLSDARTLRAAQEQMGTQGDGNHFLFVGRSRATGRTAMITHHGSRGVGGFLYKHGLAVAERFRRDLSPATLPQNAWIPADGEEGRAYWEALQLVRRWTKANHNAIHQATAEAARAEVGHRFWNEHNFVFQRDGLFLHGKGATPAWDGYAADATGLTLVPLNMAEPVLVVRGRDNPAALGFSPHGAGRNFSRTEHRRRMGSLTAEGMLARETQGLDVRFWAGAVDASELPSSYKRAGEVVRQIERFGLATIEDYIDPVGCLMAGDQPAPWRNKARGRR